MPLTASNLETVMVYCAWDTNRDRKSQTPAEEVSPINADQERPDCAASGIFILQVMANRYEKVRNVLLRMDEPSHIITDIYVPCKEHLMRLKGKWVKAIDPLLPNYLFVETTDLLAMRDMLPQVPEYKTLLSMGGYGSEKIYYALTPEETQWVHALCGKNHLSGISKARIDVENPFPEGSKVHIIDGPLKTLTQEGRVTKVDIHRRIAYVRFPEFMGGASVALSFQLLSDEVENSP